LEGRRGCVPFTRSRSVELIESDGHPGGSPATKSGLSRDLLTAQGCSALAKTAFFEAMDVDRHPDMSVLFADHTNGLWIGTEEGLGGGTDRRCRC
jgi:ligand-binding sensor domain-containing protein